MASVRKKRLSDDRIVYQAIWREGAGKDRRQRTKNFDSSHRCAHLRSQDGARGRAAPRRLSRSRDRRRVSRRTGSPSSIRSSELSVTTRAGYRALCETRHPRAWDDPARAPHRPGSRPRLRQAQGRRAAPHARRSPRPRGPHVRSSARSILHLHRVLHGAFEQARKWRHIAENPARDASPPSPGKSPVKAFTDDQVNLLLAEATSYDPELHLAIACLLTGGMRRSELLGLAFDCVDLDAGRITIRRSRGRERPISSRYCASTARPNRRCAPSRFPRR